MATGLTDRPRQFIRDQRARGSADDSHARASAARLLAIAHRASSSRLTAGIRRTRRKVQDGRRDGLPVDPRLKEQERARGWSRRETLPESTRDQRPRSENVAEPRRLERGTARQDVRASAAESDGLPAPRQCVGSIATEPRNAAASDKATHRRHHHPRIAKAVELAGDAAQGDGERPIAVPYPARDVDASPASQGIARNPTPAQAAA